MTKNFDYAEIIYEIGMKIRVRDVTDQNGVCPLTVYNALKMFLKKYEDVSDVLELTITPR